MVCANFPAASGGSDETCDRLPDRRRPGRGAPCRAEDAPAKSLATTGVTVIDATGAPARPDMTVVVTGDRITAVGKSGEVGVPEGALVVDGKGKYLIPGLWDMHAHLADESFYDLLVRHGVTGARHMMTINPRFSPREPTTRRRSRWPSPASPSSTQLGRRPGRT